MNYDNRYEGIGVIETAHAASVLIFLLSNDGCRKSDIYRNVSHTATMSKKIDMLEESGLVMQNETARGVNIFLTDAGREVALHLSEIERIIDSSVVSDRRRHRDSGWTSGCDPSGNIRDADGIPVFPDRPHQIVR